MSPATPSDWFPTTAWCFIRAAQDHGHPESLPAVNRFVAQCWKPVFYFLRAKGYALHAAEDLTQEFFLRFLERDWIQRADPQKGRFRNFLLKILVRFLSDQGPKRAPRQQWFEKGLVSIDSLLGDPERSYEPPTGQTPEAIFMKQWAAGLVEHVLKRVRRFHDEEGRAVWYEVFSATHFVSQPAERVSQHDLGERFGMTRDQVRYAQEMVQKRLSTTSAKRCAIRSARKPKSVTRCATC
jgi:RNA polymerase sigma-70 factor (ECF subfamily)